MCKEVNSTARKRGEQIGASESGLSIAPQQSSARALGLNVALIVALMGLVYIGLSFLIPQLLLPLVMESLI